MQNPYQNAIQKATQKAIRSNKDVIVTDPRVTRKGNSTCQACLMAAKKGTPLPPDHANCRCRVINKPTNY